MSDFEKIFTDNPLMDEIIYNCKLMIEDGIILKDQLEADSLETQDTIRYSDLYMACIDNFVTFKMFRYSEEVLAKVIPSLSNEDIDNYAGDNSLIPIEYRPLLLEYIRKYYIENYEEENNYYRKLNGLPDYGTDPLYIEKDKVPDNIASYIDFEKPIHEQSDEILEAMESCGFIDELYEDHKDLKYLRHLSKRKISIYDARKADRFKILYVPQCDAIEVRDRFIALLSDNINIYNRCYYDEAYAYKSDYYDKFMIIMIILQTFTDAITEMPEYYIRKDVFDLRTIQYMFEASGVEFFPDIPIRYQISLVRNLNKLIKYKSTDKCIVDIVSLFGFDNIEVFKYYLFKDRNVNIDGNYIESQDPNKKYDLKFIKVPIGELVDDYLKDDTNITDYDTTVNEDKFWDFEYDHDEVKKVILDYEFNILRTKYYSIKSIYSMQQYMFQMTYFMNILFNNNLDKELLMINVPYIQASGTIVDLFVLMYALAHIYYGTNDEIIDRPDEVLKILGFNFDLNFSELAQYLADNYITAEELGIDDMMLPDNGIFTFNQLMTIYTKNKAVYDHVVHEMITADNYRIYSIYKKIYDSLMITDLNQKYFTLEDGNMATSFAEFLEHKNPSLYSVYEKYAYSSDEEDARNKSIATCIYNISVVIEEYLNMDQLQFIFSGLSAASIESVKKYAMDVVDFFKSFKISILDMNIIYKLDDRLMNKVKMIDNWIANVTFEKKMPFPYNDIFGSIKTKMIKKFRYDLIEKLYTSRIFYRLERDKYNIKDIINGQFNTFTISDNMSYNDIIALINYIYDVHEDAIPKERLYITSKITCIERYQPLEMLTKRYMYN